MNDQRAARDGPATTEEDRRWGMKVTSNSGEGDRDNRHRCLGVSKVSEVSQQAGVR